MGEMRLSTGYLRHLAEFAPGELDRRYFAAVAAEIERLRGENENLRAEVAELQALINAWAAAADWSWVPGDPTNALAAAEDALLAAATKKEDDRG